MRHQAVVHTRHIHSMIAMIVISRGILDNRGNPHRSKAKGLDIVEFVYQSLEITSPCRISLIGVLIIPALPVVAWVAIIKTGGNNKIYAFIAEVGPASHEAIRRIDCHTRHNAADKKNQ